MITLDRWTVEPIAWNANKLQGFWGLLQKYPTLFSDLTRGDYDNFEQSMLAPTTLVLEVREGSIPVGYFKFTDLHQEVDCNGHVVFFDRKPAEKVQLGKLVCKWMFDSFPLQRITAEIPEIYLHTLRFAERVGFKQEGRKRKAVCLGNRWVDLILFGLLREESYGRH